jgi:hypothetical protein
MSVSIWRAISTARRLSARLGMTRISLRRKRSPEARRKKSRMNMTTPPATSSVARLNMRSPRVSVVTWTACGCEPPTWVIFSTCSVALLMVCTGFLNSRSRRSTLRRVCGAFCAHS